MRENRTQIDYHIRIQIEQSLRALGFEKTMTRERQGILGQQYVWKRKSKTAEENKKSEVELEKMKENFEDEDLPF